MKETTLPILSGELVMQEREEADEQVTGEPRSRGGSPRAQEGS